MSARPIVLLAAPFSGSSWLAGALAALPGVYAVPQLCAFMADRVGELAEIFALSQDEHGDGLHRAVAELYFGGQAAAQIAEARAWLAVRGALRVQDLLDELAAKVAPRRLLLPETEAPLRPADLRRLRDWQAAPDLVHLVRHPWAQGCRFAAWLQDRLFVPVDFRDHSRYPPLPDPQIAWLRANENLERFFAEVPAERRHRVSSEALDADFRTSFSALAEALGFGAQAASWVALRDPADWVYARRGPAEAAGGLEAEVWTSWPEEVEALARQPRLDLPLPWRPDGRGFAPQVLALAATYGYR